LVAEQLVPRVSGSTIARHPLRHEGVEPGFIADGQQETRGKTRQQAKGGEQDMPARRAHGGGKAAAEEIAGRSQDSRARPLEDQERTEAEILQIEEEIAVEGDAAGGREGGERRTVEQRQALQLLDREHQETAAFDLLDEALELPPASLPPLAEFAR